MISRTILTSLLFAMAVPTLAGPQQPPPQAPAPKAAADGQDRVAALKQSVQASMAALRHYQWVETTTILRKGKEKSKKLSRCSYGADGMAQKVPLGEEQPEAKTPRGLRGKIAANKKEDITEAMQMAVDLVKQYVPLETARIQAAKDAGLVTVHAPDSRGSARIEIRDYNRTGDTIVVDLDAAANRLTGVSVSTWTDEVKHAVKLHVVFRTLDDGTSYPATIRLDVAQEDITVAIENSGHQKIS